MRSIAGLAAAQQQDWKLAIRYFLDAQKIDPDASQVWFNLGLASSKLPDHEFRAIAWFKGCADPSIADGAKGAKTGPSGPAP